MGFLVVGFALQELLEGTDRLARLFPFELEGRELFRRRDQLPVRLLTVPIDPRGAQVGEEFPAVNGHRGPEVLDSLSRSPGIACFAAPPKRSAEDLEVDVDRQRERQTISGVGADHARRFGRARGRERLAERVQREVEVGERGRRVRLRPELGDEIVPRDRLLTVEEHEREELLRLARSPAAVADARAARAELERSEHERLDALRSRGWHALSGGWYDGRGLKKQRERACLVRRDLKVGQSLTQCLGECGPQQEEIPITLRGDGAQRGLRRLDDPVGDCGREENGLYLEVTRTDGTGRGAGFAVCLERAVA